MSEFKEVFRLADILLPSNSLSEDFSVYPVIACDQHTSEPEYWSEVSRLVGDDPSTLNMMIPEIYLDKADEYRFRLKAVNGEIIIASQGYTAKSSAKNGIDSIRRNADSDIIDETLIIDA